jgi:hypothetical protein
VESQLEMCMSVVNYIPCCRLRWQYRRYLWSVLPRTPLREVPCKSKCALQEPRCRCVCVCVWGGVTYTKVRVLLLTLILFPPTNVWCLVHIHAKTASSVQEIAGNPTMKILIVTEQESDWTASAAHQAGLTDDRKKH